MWPRWDATTASARFSDQTQTQTQAANRRAAQHLRRAYLLLVPAFLLQATPASIAFVPLMVAGWGIWLTATGGSSRSGQQRSVSLAVFQTTALVPLLGHVLLAMASLARLAPVVSGGSQTVGAQGRQRSPTPSTEITSSGHRVSSRSFGMRQATRPDVLQRAVPGCR